MLDNHLLHARSNDRVTFKLIISPRGQPIDIQLMQGEDMIDEDIDELPQIEVLDQGFMTMRGKSISKRSYISSSNNVS